jgi:ferredoxin-NADP reductase
MSSSPETDGELMVTVKRTPGGHVSNWMHDHLAAGDLVEVTAPAGVFCLRESSAPLIAFCGGSGITPIMSLVKSALATTSRRVRVLAANRDAESVIFGPALQELAGRYPGRLDVRHHLDAREGLVTDDRVRAFLGGDRDADFYICGPAPFMDLIERTLLAAGADPGQIFIERFETGASEPAAPRQDSPPKDSPPKDSPPKDSAQQAGTVTIVLAGKRHTLPRRDGETVLECARRAGLSTPFSCEAGNCATCIAQITEGGAVMRVNDALDDDEVADGWVLTCQGEPVSQHLTVVFED